MTKIVKGAGAGVAAGPTTRLAKGRVDQYLLKMNNKGRREAHDGLQVAR
jgi:hypothetical protein